MATRSHLEKEPKQQQGEGSTEPENKVVAAPGDSSGTSKADTGPAVPTVSSYPSLSGGAALWGEAAGVSSCVMVDARTISTAGEDPGPPSMPCVRESGCPELQGSPSPDTELSCVGPELAQGLQNAHAGSQAWTGQAVRGAVQASGRPTHTTGPANGRGRKPHSRKKAAQAHKLPLCCLFPEAPVSQSSVSLPPLSPRAQPSRRRRTPRASQGSLASQPGPDLRGRTTPPPSGPVLRSRATLRRPAVCCCPSEPGPAYRLRSASASTAASARSPAARSGRAPAPPRCAVRNQASESGTGLRSRGCSRGRAPGRCASPPGPARRLRRHCAPSPVPDPQRGASAPGSTRRRRTSRPRGRPGCSASVPITASHSRASRPGPALQSQASGSSPALRSGSSPMSSALSSSTMAAGCVPRSRTTQRRSTRSSRLALPEPDGQRPPSPGLTSGSLVFQSSSSPPDPGAPGLPSEPSWHAVRMRASSPSPPGRLYPFPGWFVENPSSSTSTCPSPQSSLCTSSSGFPDQGPSSPPAIVSDHSSSSSSPNLDDPASISTLSPASLRRTLLLEFDALSPASPGEPAEIENIRDSPTPPPGEL